MSRLPRRRRARCAFMARLWPKRAGAKAFRRRSADRDGDRTRRAGVDAARLRRLRPRRLHAERRSSTAAVRMIAEAAASRAAAALRGRARDRRASAARSPRAAQRPGMTRHRSSREPGTATCSSPATPTCEAVGIGGELARAARAAPRPHEGDPRSRRLAGGVTSTRPAAPACASPARRRPACAPILHLQAVPSRSTTTTACARSRRPPPPSTSTTRPRAGTRRCSTIPRGPPARSSIPPAAAPDGRAVRAPEERTGGELPGRAQRRPAAAARRRARLEADVASRRKDMDFIEAKNAAAREIALASACRRCCSASPATTPTPTTQEANRAFWRQTVLPLVNRTAQALSAWLTPAYGGGLRAVARPRPGRGAVAGARGAVGADRARELPHRRREARRGRVWRRVDGNDFPQERKLKSDQPRVPAGQPGGGRWTGDGGGGAVADTGSDDRVHFVQIEGERQYSCEP